MAAIQCLASASVSSVQRCPGQLVRPFGVQRTARCFFFQVCVCTRRNTCRHFQYFQCTCGGVGNPEPARTRARSFSMQSAWSAASARAGLAPEMRLDHAPACPTRHSVRSQAGREEPGPSAPAGGQQDTTQTLVSIGIAALWIGIAVYAFMYSPNQTPYRDQIFLERMVGLGEKDGFVINPIFVSLFNLMGVYPALYAALMVPAARSENKIPAWPFVAGSFAFGAFALLPYMALWRPKRDNQVPPPPEELEGWNRLFMKGAETPYLPAVLLAVAGYYIFQAATAGGYWWLDYFKLFDESRFTHVMSLDFATLTALVPFWMDNDATARKWDKRSQLLPVLSLLPVVGPAVYLLLRPKTQQAGGPASQ